MVKRNKNMAGSRVAPAETSAISNPRLRRMSGHLPKLDIPNDNHKNPFFPSLLPRHQCSKEETIEEGKMLMGTFIVDEMVKEKDIITTEEIRHELEIFTPKDCANPAWAKAGQELRMYADEFMRSKEREKVRVKANQMGQTVCTKDSVTRDQFRDFLCGLLSEGITRERILVLFFFCADVAIATLRHNDQSSPHLCKQLIEWSLQFMVEHVCTWVQEHGGWSAVFNSSLQLFGKCAMVVAGVSLVCYMGYKRLTK